MSKQFEPSIEPVSEPSITIEKAKQILNSARSTQNIPPNKDNSMNKEISLTVKTPPTSLKKSIDELVKGHLDGRFTHSDLHATATEWSKQLKDTSYIVTNKELMKDINEELAKQKQAEKSEAPDKPTLDVEALERAKSLGRKNLVEEFQAALRTLGCVIDRDMARALMHTIWARLLKQKKGWLYYGRSRTGKSVCLEAAYRLLHSSNKMRATSMTPGAIYSLGHLDNIFILGGELSIVRPGEDDPMQQLFRQFLSEPEISHHRLDKSKTPAGESYKRTENVVTGVASLAWTTTKDPYQLKDEFALRLTSVKSNESEETTKEVLNLKADRFKNSKGAREAEEAIIKVFNELDLSFKSYDVNIPFADVIKLSPKDPTARGIYELLCLHVQISALINQHKPDRKLSEEGCIEATFDDYEAGFKLIENGAYRVSQGMSNEALSAYEVVRRTWPISGGHKFTLEQLRILLAKPRTTVQGYLKQWKKVEAAEECDERGPRRAKLYTCLEYNQKADDFGLIPVEIARALYTGSFENRSTESDSATRQSPETDAPRQFQLPTGESAQLGDASAPLDKLSAKLPNAEEMPKEGSAVENMAASRFSLDADDDDDSSFWFSMEDVQDE